ncbi:magnesium transporter CorA family protein [Candidatus Uhrbacteria bacterium]|nr:magnesium transporter CorA family protein [Candidatus Uhrbacteria bacterium]
MGVHVLESKGIRWHHVSGVVEKDLEALQAQFKFHHLDYDDIRNASPISKMDAYKHYVFFLFHIPMMNETSGRIYGEPVYVFLSKDDVVTVTYARVAELDFFFKRLSTNAKSRAAVLGKGTSFAVYRIISHLFNDALGIVSLLTQEVHRLEETIERRHDKRLTVELGHARRNVLFLRHLVDPQRNMLLSLRHTPRPFIPEEVYVYFDDLHDTLDTLWLSSDNLQLLLDGLFDVNEALISHKTNQVITLLTVLSAALMVPALIAGFYGMNATWLPYVENATIVSLLLGVGFLGMLVLVATIVYRKRL